MEFLITAAASVEAKATRCDCVSGGAAHQRRPEVSFTTAARVAALLPLVSVG